MRWLLLPLLGFGLAACPVTNAPGDDDDSVAEPTPTPAPTAVDEACAPVTDSGDPSASDGELAGLVRLNCYRNLLGLPTVRMHPALNAAARAHAAYMDTNDSYGHQETDPSAPGFTGEWVADRALAAGYAWDATLDDVEEVVAVSTEGADAARSIDRWIDTVYHRVPLAQPEIVEVGLGQAGDFDVLVVVAPWEPPGTLRRLAFPADGQFGVPTSFDSDLESPDPSPLGVVGYPLSVTVQGPWTGPFEDPHTLRLAPATSSLTGPDGPVSFVVLDPSNDASLREFAFLLPDAPLAAGASYDMVLSGTAEGVEFRIESTFETAP